MAACLTLDQKVGSLNLSVLILCLPQTRTKATSAMRHEIRGRTGAIIFGVQLAATHGEPAPREDFM